MKTIFTLTTKCLLLALCLLLTGNYLQAQVTVGSGDAAKSFSVLEISTANVKGGLRLPHLDSGQRDDLSATQAFQDAKNRPGSAALGLTIYNTTTNCIEYWDGNKWVSLCLGTAEIAFNNEAGAPVASDLTFPAEGSEQGPFVPVDVPNCTVENPPFAFALVTGSEYTSIDIIDASTGKFTVRMEPNPMAKERSAILRITNNCTGEYKEFIFSQAGDPADCGNADPLVAIQSYSGNELCRNGSLTLNLPESLNGTFIWTLAGKEVGRGNFLTVTEPGKYTVYGDKIGCANETSITITRGTTVAPAPVDFIVIGNNGVACGEFGKVELIVNTASEGDIVWYKNGVRTLESGRSIQAGKGRWFVVVEDGTCNSLASKGVDVIENKDVAVLDEPKMKVNDAVVTPGSTLNLCRGGSMYLQVTNIDPDARYTWYINNTEVATGVNAYVPVPTSDLFILRVRATGTGCATEALVEAEITSGTAPDLPFIVVDTDDVLCGGQATLTAINSPTATSYRWFKDGVEYPGTTASITVTTVGSYTVSAIAGGCSSIQSAAKAIATSDFAKLSWGNHPDAANVGETKTYSVSLDFPQSASYTWTVSGSAFITNGDGTSTITVTFPVAENVNVICTAKNACGKAAGSPLSQSVDVSSNCTPAEITNTSNLNPSVKLNLNVALSVTASGTGPLSYQWFLGAVGTTTTPVGVGATLAVSNNTLGEKLYWCRVIAGGTCTTPANSPQFKVTVTQNPDTYPVGKGTFIGKTCFDIADGNNGSKACGTTASRANQKTVFSDPTKQDPEKGSKAPYSGVQVYTFTPIGSVSNVRFDYVDGTGQVIESVTPEGIYSGGSISGSCKVRVQYKASLDSELKGKTRETGLKAELYVIYNNGASNNGTDMKLKLNLSFQDCACCGAKTVNGSWLTFMCYNLGADENIDPFVYYSDGDSSDADSKGFLYQWGRRTDGHQRRSSKTTTVLSPSNVPGNGNFILTSAYPNDWHTGGGSPARWGDGTLEENPPKAANDPCPKGWKVPSRLQWISIFNGNPAFGQSSNSGTANTWTWKSNSYNDGGFMVGDALFLPAAGKRNERDGKFLFGGSSGHYWSSTNDFSDLSFFLSFNQDKVNPAYSTSRATGYSVRCVEE